MSSPSVNDLLKMKVLSLFLLVGFSGLATWPMLDLLTPFRALIVVGLWVMAGWRAYDLSRTIDRAIQDR
jgi:hypothetical protein